MKPIDTYFDGYKFRSRLEARWAVFFKTLGVKYQYEHEGYELNGKYYLPDFWLPHLDCFIEIKGKEPEPHELQKAYLLKKNSGKEVYILFGNIPLIEEVPLLIGGYRILEPTRFDDRQWWTECVECQMIGLCKYGLAHLLPCHHINVLWQLYHTLRIREAYIAARSERFGT